MFRFAHPDFLYLLFLLPVLVVFYVYAIVLKKKAIKKYGNPELLTELMPEVFSQASASEVLAVVRSHYDGYHNHGRTAVRFQTGESEASGSGDYGLPGRIQFDVGGRCLARPAVQGQTDVVQADGRLFR